MTLAYQYDASGYFAGQIDDHGGPLPNNATRSQPDLREGFIPRWDGQAWQQAENHQGKEGYLHGRPHTINQYGPYPAGWSDTPPPPSPDEQEQALLAKIQARLDEFAQTRNYDGIVSAATYADSSMPKYRLEGRYAMEARDATWAVGYALAEAVRSGQRPMPTPEELAEELPPLAWPEE